MQPQWTVDGVVLALPARDGPVAVVRLLWSCAVLAVLAGVFGTGFLLRPPPAPVCASAQLCKAHLPPELNPEPPEREAYVTDRVAEVLESVRTLDRLPSDVDVVDHLTLGEPGFVEWAFLAAEHHDHSIMAETPEPAGLSAGLREALAQYRHEAGEGRVHFQDGTRFVAEIQAVRAAVDRQAARARLDDLADRNRSVLDLGTASARDLVRAATHMAGAEWSARRQLEEVRLAEVTTLLRERRARADVAWLFGMALVGVGLAAAFLMTGLLGLRGWRAVGPVLIDVSGAGIRLDGQWIERESIVWVGLRDGALRVVTRESDLTSRRVDDDRSLHAALRLWRQLSEVTGDHNPADEARVRQLL